MATSKEERETASLPPAGTPWTVALTGASGLVGRALAAALAAAGHRVLRLVRRPGPSRGERVVHWQPEGEEIDAARLEGVDAVVHLAGESIFALRWTAEKKRRILDSRTYGTRLLANALAGLERKPRVLVSVSGMSYYGDRGDDLLREDEPPGDLFLSRVAVAWEAVADPARDAGIRVVHPRLGLVLSRDGGALATMLPAFRFGLGGRVGSGEQWVSWITREDLVRAIDHCLGADDLAGPVNLATPEPVRFRDFVRELGRAVHRPTLLPVPAALVRVGLGEMADELLLPSVRLDVGRLLESGFAPRHPRLAEAFAALLR